MLEPTYLYVKTHNKTGLKYFGKTTRDPFNYNGSGLYWLRHLKIHGNDISTEIIGYYTDREQLMQFAIEFSIKNNIVESHEWANLIVENGINGGSVSSDHTPETRRKMSLNRRGKPSWNGKKHSEESKLKMSIAKKNKPSPKKGIPSGKPAYNKGISMSDDQKRLISKTKKENMFTICCLRCKKIIKGKSNYIRWHSH